MLVKKEVIDKIGGLDERFGMGGNDDLDYSIRIKEAGYRLKVGCICKSYRHKKFAGYLQW
jgi:hypothetical protein